MVPVSLARPTLVAGEILSREEFLRRWEAMPGLKLAELIRGVVHMPSPLSLDHGDLDHFISLWLGMYGVHTPGCQGSTNATWLMSEVDAPQPDTSLRILPEWGGQSRREGAYAAGAPEFLVEVSGSSSHADLHIKRDLYEESGVQEYLVVLVTERILRWHRRVEGRFVLVDPDVDGVFRSSVFAGLWLEGASLLRGDMARVLSVLQQGLATPEHQAFVQELARRYQEGRPRAVGHSDAADE